MKGERDDWLEAVTDFLQVHIKGINILSHKQISGAYTDSLQKIIANALPFFNNEEDAPEF